MSLKIRAGLLLAALALSGCPRPAVPDDVPAYEPARTFDAERVRQRLSEAIARYEAGDFGRAVELFRLFGAEFPGHPDEARAELYLGRALIAASQPVEARQVLEPLAGGSADTAATARFYVAFIDSLEDRLPAALDAIGSWSAERSIDDLLGLVLPGDEPLALSLVAESQFAAGRDASGLEALARLARLDGAGSLAEYARIRSSERMALDVPAERVAEVWSQLGPEARADVLCGAAGALSSSSRNAESSRLFVESGLPADGSSCGLSLTPSAAPSAPTYGVLLTLSGPTRRAGRAALGGVLLAQRAFERSPAVSRVVIRDTYGTAEGVESGMDELAAAGVTAVIGPIEPALVEVARRAAAGHSVALLSLSPEPFESGLHGTYRYFLDASAEAERGVEAAVQRRGAHSFCLVTESDSADGAFLDRFAEAARADIEARGGVVSCEVTVDAAPAGLQASAEAAARRVASTPPDAVVLAVTSAPASAVAAHLAAANIWPNDGAPSRERRTRTTYVLNSFAADEALLRNASSYLAGAFVPYWFLPTLARDGAATFRNRFKFHFGREPGEVEAFAFDAATVVRDAMLRDGLRSGPALIRRFAENWASDGVVGTLRFDAFGNPRLRPRLATIRGTQFEAVE